MCCKTQGINSIRPLPWPYPVSQAKSSKIPLVYHNQRRHPGLIHEALSLFLYALSEPLNSHLILPRSDLGQQRPHRGLLRPHPSLLRLSQASRLHWSFRGTYLNLRGPKAPSEPPEAQSIPLKASYQPLKALSKA